MKSAPCVRLAIRISPKMSENPAARRNSNPPSARLLSVWIAQYCNQESSRASSPRRRGPSLFSKNSSPSRTKKLGPRLRGDDGLRLLLEVFRRREVARIHRVLQELLRLVRPELAHVRIGVDHRVDEPAFLARHLADVHVADHVAVLVELHRPAAGVEVARAHRLHERLLVLD